MIKRTLSKTNGRKAIMVLAAAAAAAGVAGIWPARAGAAEKDWNVNFGSWNSPGNWLQNAVPQPGDDVNVTISTLGNVSSLYNMNTSIHQLTIDNTTAGQTNTVGNLANNPLSLTGNMYVGYSGRGAFNQADGNITIGSTNTTATLYVGFTSTATGNYTLQSGTLTTYGNEIVGIGNQVAATFTQSGGINTIGTPSVNAGLDVLGNALYTLSGSGVLIVNGIESTSQGAMIQSGGTNTNLGLYVAFGEGDFGSYTLSSGTLTVNGPEIHQGHSLARSTFIQSGGVHTINDDTTGFQMQDESGSKGGYSLSGTGSLVVNAPEYIGYAGTTTFTQSGGTHTVGTAQANQNLDLGNSSGAVGIYSLSSTGSLTVNGTEVIGDSGAATFTQAGGTNTINAPFFGSGMFIGAGSTGVGTYNLQTGGTLSDNQSEYIGLDGHATFNQSGGSNSVPDLRLAVDAGSVGVYNMSGGTLNTSAFELIGHHGSATFTQSGGTHTANSTFLIGVASGSTGTYALSNSSSQFTVNGSAYVGGDTGTAGGTGILTIAGGTMNVNATFKVWDTTGTQVNLSGGALNVRILDSTANQSRFFNGWTGGTLGILGPGTSNLGALTMGSAAGVTLNQTGGMVSVSTLDMSHTAGNSATYLLSSAAKLTSSGALDNFVGEFGSATFTQSGTSTATFGTVGSPANLSIGNYSGASGTYSLSDVASLRVTGNEFVGVVGNGTFIQSGGAHHTNSLYVADNTGSNGFYSLGGSGSLTVDFFQVVGWGATGSFVQSGGTATTSSLTVGQGTSGVGTYQLSGSGRLTVNGSETVGALGGTGSFNQTGGTHVVQNTLTVADQVAGSAGSYSLSSPGVLTSANTAINTNGSFQFSGGSASLGSLTMAGTGRLTMTPGHDKMLVLSSLSITNTAQLDLSDNGLVVNYAAGDTTHSVRDQIRNLLVNGRNGGAGQPGAWNGLGGISSSFAHANGNGFDLAIGYGDNEDIALVRGSGSYTAFGGQTVSSNTVLVQMTRGADATLDGVVDAQDVTILGSHFNKPNSGQWVFGDFDYSGTCDATDVTTLGSTFGKTTPTLSPAQMTAEFGSAFTSAFETGQDETAPVPEPGTLFLLGFGSAAGLARRRRRNSTQSHPWLIHRS